MGKKETFRSATVRLLGEAKAAGYEVQTKSSKAPWNDLKKPRIYRKQARFVAAREAMFASERSS